MEKRKEKRKEKKEKEKKEKEEKERERKKETKKKWCDRLIKMKRKMKSGRGRDTSSSLASTETLSARTSFVLI